MEESYRGIYILPSSNNTPSSLPSDTGSKRKAIPEKNDDEFPADIGDDYSLYPLIVGKMYDVSCGNGSMNSYTLS